MEQGAVQDNPVIGNFAETHSPSRATTMGWVSGVLLAKAAPGLGQVWKLYSQWDLG